MVLLSPFGNKTMHLGVKERSIEITPGIKISEFIPEGRATSLPSPVPAPKPAMPGFTSLPAVVSTISLVLLSWVLRNRTRHRNRLRAKGRDRDMRGIRRM